MHVRDPPQNGIDVFGERDFARVGDGEPGIEARHHVVDGVVERDDVLNRRREIRRRDNHPGRIGGNGRGAAGQSNRGAHRAIRDIIAPAVVIGEIFQLAFGSDCDLP